MGGLAQNLLEGFASAAGDQNTVDRFEKQKADKTAMSHAELRDQTQSVLADVTGLQDKRSKLDPNSPTYADDLKANDKALHDARSTLQDLYHPEKNPGALAHLGGFIRAHIGKQPAATPATIKQDMASRIAGLDASAAPAAGKAPDGSLLSHEDQVKAERIKAGLDPRAAAAKPKYVREDRVSADGKPLTVFRNAGDPSDILDSTGQPIDAEILKHSSMSPKAGAQSNSKFNEEASVYEKHWGTKLKDWSPEQLTYFNAKMAYDAQHSGASTTTKLEKDEFGNIRPVEISTIHGPMHPPVEPGTQPASKSAPRTAGEAKARVQRPAGPSVKVGEPLPFTAATPAITKAQTDFQEATKLSSVADQVSKKPDDAVNQKRLAVALERASAGRFTTQALDYIIKAGWGNTIEQWANNPSTGALPTDVLRQLVDGAHQNLQGAKDALAAAHGPAGGGAPAAAQSSGKAVSLAKAKLLPQMKGKTDEQIKQAIEASGHTVKP